MADIDLLIGTARAIYDTHGAGLFRDKEIAKLLSGYRDNIGATNRLMRQSDIISTCSTCAKEAAGSCCMQAVEEWYDPVLLLINLLMGVEFPDFREIPGHCFFVGKNGCKLLARYSFCVNYLCPRLKALLGRSRTQDLMTAAGQELLSGWEVEKSIRIWLHSRSMDLSCQCLAESPS